ncbi:MAG: hypothetical protein H6937_09525 [Burkholderiales bacterium]|nr:hypothetical protein [Burkholderiales bacterium]
MLEEHETEEQKLAEQVRFRRAALGKVVAKIRDRAVEERRASGFETQWQQDEDYYDGVDDYNDRNISDYQKPRSKDGVLTSEKKSSDEIGSTAFINIVGAFSDYAAARMGDILLPANEWNFKSSPTPVPDIEELEGDETVLTNIPPTYDQEGNQVDVTVDDAVKEAKKIISERADKASLRIKDWLTEGGYKPESRKVIEGATRLGTGVLKGPFPEASYSRVHRNGVLQVVKEIKPVSKCISVWDCFPDMNCGEDIQEGEYFFERDFLTARQLLNLKEVPSYDADAIDHVIKEGPGKINETTNESTKDSDRYEVWYGYVTIKSEELALIDSEYAEECGCEDPEEPVDAVVVLVNETVIKAYQRELSEDYPYDFFVWKRITGKPFGMGVPRQGRQAQSMLNASVRALMDNMGLSAIPMIGIIKDALTPVDGSWKIRKGKVWRLNTKNSPVTDIRQAIQTLVIPSMQAELTANIELSMKFMEDITGITFLLQGQQGSAPDTVGGMNLLHQNASTVLRRCGRIYDENLTEPHIKRYYQYLLVNEDVPDDEKGDLQINATGSSHLIEREIQSMQLPMILQMISANPTLEMSPKKTAQELIRSLKFDPSKFEMDEEEKQLYEQMQQGQVAPQVQAAQIRAETDLQKEQLRQEANVQKIQVDMDRDRVFAQGVTERNQMSYEKNIMDAQLRIREMELKLQLAQLDYAEKHSLKLEEVKAKLASDTMKLNLQKELAYSKETQAAEQVITPPSEPAGRAPDGMAFQR